MDSVWDAVEDRYRAEGHWSDPLGMYLQRVEGTEDPNLKGSLFLRIGQVLRDEMDDPQQALDAYVEALVLDPRSTLALKAVEDAAREQGWWTEAPRDDEEGAAQREVRPERRRDLRARGAVGRDRAPGRRRRRSPFLDCIRKLDPGAPRRAKRTSPRCTARTGAWASQREALERALLQSASGDEERRTLHLTLGGAERAALRRIR